MPLLRSLAAGDAADPETLQKLVSVTFSACHPLAPAIPGTITAQTSGLDTNGGGAAQWARLACEVSECRGKGY
jgi:hypothetical protein